MPLISKRAIRTYLERPRQDYRRFKKLTTKQLRAEMEKLPARPPIWKPLQKHQKVCLLMGAMHHHWGFHLDTGMGKTLLSIALGLYFKKIGTIKQGQKLLILVPNKINKAGWAREFKKWARELDRPELRKAYCVLRGSSQAKWEKLERTKALFVIETYGGLAHMVCTKATTKKGKSKLRPKPALVKKLIAHFAGFVLDESTNAQSRKSLAFRVMRQLRKTSLVGFELTGTPFGRDPTALWAQLFLLDRGYTLGETLGLFRAAFFHESKNNWGGFEYTFKKDKEKLLNKFLACRTTSYEVDQSDLPKLIPIVRELVLPHDAQVYLDRARETLIAARGNFSEQKNAFIRMRQISSGFLGYKDDDTGAKAELVFPENPKLDELVSDILDIDERYKLIVFHDFIVSGDIICNRLTKEGISWGRISGKTKAHEHTLANFDRASGFRVLVLNNKFAFGPNLQAARYGMFYEAPVPCITRKQARRRFERQGSEHQKVFMFDYVVHDTYDQRILDFHAQGKDLFDAIIRGKVKP